MSELNFILNRCVEYAHEAYEIEQAQPVNPHLFDENQILCIAYISRWTDDKHFMKLSAVYHRLGNLKLYHVDTITGSQQELQERLKLLQVPYFIAKNDTHKTLSLSIVEFGKMMGENMYVIVRNNRGYIDWFRNKYQTEAWTDSRGRVHQPILTEKDHYLKKTAALLLMLHPKPQQVDNEKDKESKHISTIGNKLTFTGQVREVKRGQDYVKVTLLVGNDLAYIYPKSELEQGKVYEFKGSVAAHKEYRGVNWTYFNRVKVIREIA